VSVPVLALHTDEQGSSRERGYHRTRIRKGPTSPTTDHQDSSPGLRIGRAILSYYLSELARIMSDDTGMVKLSYPLQIGPTPDSGRSLARRLNAPLPGRSIPGCGPRGPSGRKTRRR